MKELVDLCMMERKSKELWKSVLLREKASKEKCLENFR